MVKTLTVTDRFDGLRFVLGIMQAYPCPCSDGIFACQRLESIYRFALNAFCRTGRVTEVEFFFDAMKSSIDGKPNVVMNGFCKGRKHVKVVEWYDRMSKKDRVKPDIFSFNIMISSYVRNSVFETALEVFKEMKLKNCNPNVASFKSLNTGFFKLRRFDEISCTTLMEGLKRRKMIDKACFLMEGMVMQGMILDCVTFNLGFWSVGFHGKVGEDRKTVLSIKCWIKDLSLTSLLTTCKIS
ncbi:hypothetical protein ZOSMA_171G00260 [Zostera marina]|uniref:Pentatricopeptide repeat-containing protein n=1 Tax=Zostera marina TaxID=29655 RepID=A0A0K9PSL5_ZOSMR|nr:hypothetical protein ZOSMA_171G00260 [Zostera marina]